MLKETPGTIDFTLHMMLMDLFSYSEENKSFQDNFKSYSKDLFIGLYYGYQILIIGQEISTIFFQFGCLTLLIGMI
jgi:hypothetical protein